MPKFKIEKVNDMKIRATEIETGEFIQSNDIEVILQFAILEKLEEIRCGLIDVETAIED
jgi:hypothetical protein